MQTMKKILLAVGIAGSIALAGCAGMSDTEQRTLSGGAIGAAGGAAIGAAASGKPLTGAAIGAGVGLIGGYLWDRHKKETE